MAKQQLTIDESTLQKTCTKCLQLLPLTGFHRSKARKDGHISACKACMAIYSKETKVSRAAWCLAHAEQMKANRIAWYLAHKEEVKAYLAVWCLANKEKIKGYAAANYQAHKAEKKASHAAWRQANPEKASIIGKRHRAAKANAAINDFTADQWEFIKTVYDHRCVYCPPTCWRCRQHKHALTQDHIIPLSKGGNHTASNIVPACQSCNSKKGVGAPLCPIQPLLLLA